MAMPSQSAYTLSFFHNGAAPKQAKIAIKRSVTITNTSGCQSAGDIVIQTKGCQSGKFAALNFAGATGVGGVIEDRFLQSSNRIWPEKWIRREEDNDCENSPQQGALIKPWETLILFFFQKPVNQNGDCDETVNIFGSRGQTKKEGGEDEPANFLFLFELQISKDHDQAGQRRQCLQHDLRDIFDGKGMCRQ
jgi:hypothetical protein